MKTLIISFLVLFCSASYAGFPPDGQFHETQGAGEITFTLPYSTIEGDLTYNTHVDCVMYIGGTFVMPPQRSMMLDLTSSHYAPRPGAAKTGTYFIQNYKKLSFFGYPIPRPGEAVDADITFTFTKTLENPNSNAQVECTIIRGEPTSLAKKLLSFL